MEGSGREEPDSEDVARGLFYPEYEKIDKNGVEVSPRTHLPLPKSGGIALAVYRVHIKVIIGPAKRTAGRLRELGG